MKSHVFRAMAGLILGAGVLALDFGFSGSPGLIASASAQSPATSPAPTNPASVVRPEMVRIEGGSFLIGSDSNERLFTYEGSQQTVTIAAFEVGRYEVTFVEWDACVAGGGCNGYIPSDQGWGREDRPVINVSWNDAQAYVQWLNQQTGQTYRLLTSAEWEIAARAGTTTAYSWGDQAPVCDQTARNGANFSDCPDDRTRPVGSFPANGFGLHDVHGNVWEWVQDTAMSGSGFRSFPAEGSERVFRGGSFGGVRQFLRSASRTWQDPSGRGHGLGFRLARSVLPVVRPEMVPIPGQTFEAGKYEVTFAEWDACVAGGGCNGYRPSDEGWGRDRQPVINVSWNDAQAYVQWLNHQTGLTYRLLTSAEWEIAARAGTTTNHSWGDLDPVCDRTARNGANFGACPEWQTRAVGSFQPNGFGLYDVHGNVWEWVQDAEGSSRVLRGGSWVDDPSLLPFAILDGYEPPDRNIDSGFRLARTL